MFLTRLGFGSKAVVTGDITQIDLPTGRTSGLVEAMQVVVGDRGHRVRVFRRARRRAPQARAGHREGLRVGGDGAATSRRDARGLRRAMAVPARPAARLAGLGAGPGCDRGGRRRAWGLAARGGAAAARGEVTVALSATAACARSIAGSAARTTRPTCCRSRRCHAARRGDRVARNGRATSARRARALGDIVIATGVATRQAAAAGHPSAPSCGCWRCTGCCTCSATTTRPTTAQMARVEARLRRQRPACATGLIERAAPARRRGVRR